MISEGKSTSCYTAVLPTSISLICVMRSRRGTPGMSGALGTTAAHCMSLSSSRGARSLKAEAREDRHSSRAALTVLGT